MDLMHTGKVGVKRLEFPLFSLSRCLFLLSTAALEQNDYCTRIWRTKRKNNNFCRILFFAKSKASNVQRQDGQSEEKKGKGRLASPISLMNFSPHCHFPPSSLLMMRRRTGMNKRCRTKEDTTFTLRMVKRMEKSLNSSYTK